MAGWNPLDEPEDLFAADASVGELDRTLNAFATYYPGMQTWYGTAYEVNEDLQSTFDTFLTEDRIWAGEKAVYYVVSYTYDISRGW